MATPKKTAAKPTVQEIEQKVENEELGRKIRRHLFTFGLIVMSIGVLEAIGMFQGIRLAMLSVLNLPATELKKTALELAKAKFSVEYVLMGFGFLCSLAATGDLVSLLRGVRKSSE